MRDLRKIFVLLSLVLLFCSAAFSQLVSGTIVGTVTDSSGAVIAGVKITLTEENTKVIHNGTTNSSGEYAFPDLQPGTYDVAAEMSGFKREVKTGTVLEVNTSPRVDLKLQTGDVNQTIEVSATAATLQTDRTDTGRTMDSQLVEELPLGVNRNFQNLLDLVPGTSVETFQHSQFFNASSSLQTNTNGQPRMSNSYQIEGVDNNERTGLLQVLITPGEAISTVAVSVTNHEMELGRGTGAIVNVMLKSGTNSPHGEAYWFSQNSAFDGRAFFNPSVGHLAYNQTGGNVGGAIKKNKLFYFVNFVNTQDHEANTNLETIPDNPFRTGDLSSAPTQQVYNPYTGLPSGQNRVPFPGNIIPQSMINPIALKILSYLPPTNQPITSATAQTNDYFSLLPAVKTNNQIDSDVDWVLSDKDRIRGRFSFGRPVTYQAPQFGDAGGPAQGAFEGTGVQKTYSSGVTYNRIMSPTLLTEFRVGLSHYHNEAFQSDYGKNDTTALGIPGVNLGPFTSGFIGININDYTTPLTGYSASLPWDRAETNFDFVNTWTKMLHNHTLKWGVDIRRIRDDLLQDQTYSPRGIMYFEANQTQLVTVNPTTGATTTSGSGIANDMASFLLDQPWQEARDVNTYFPAFRQWQIFSFIGDSWQVNSRLTVNMGLRWEIYTAPTPHFAGGFSDYNPSNNTLELAGIGNNPMNLGFNTRFKYFSPRTGIAYRLDDKTVFRAGYGQSYTSFPDNTWMYNFPVRSNNLYTEVSGSSDAYGPVVLPNGAMGSFEQGYPAPDPVVVPSNGIITNPNPTTAQFYIPKTYKNPYIESWNVAVQRQLPGGFLLDVAYVGSHGVDTGSSVNLNAGQIIGQGAAGEEFYSKYGTTAAVTQYFAAFSTNYQALQVKFDRRLAKGLTLTTAYTWNKAMSFQNGDDGGLEFYAGQGIERNYSRATFDRTQNYIQSYVYKLPFGHGEQFLSHGFLGKIIGGWQLSGIFSARTGTPLTFTGSNTLNLGTGGTTTDNQVAPIRTLYGINTGNPWFSTTSIKATGINNVQGDTGYDIFSGPGLVSLNAGLSRWIVLKPREGGDIRMQIRLDSLNVTNTPQFANPNTSCGTTSATAASCAAGSFGYVTSTISSGTGVNGTGGGRVVTFVVKVFF